jgi:hypothetical protein
MKLTGFQYNLKDLNMLKEYYVKKGIYVLDSNKSKFWVEPVNVKVWAY